MNKDSRIYVAGHNGMVGSAIVRKLRAEGYHNIVTASRDNYDLRTPWRVYDLFCDLEPEYVFLCAAKVGGIHANNTMRGEFIYDNIMISTNIINMCKQFNVKRLINLGSSCIYPKDAEIPIKETQLMTGPLEETNKPYAIAKISAIEMCRAYADQYGLDSISLMPTNLYGFNDTYDNLNSHVIPAMIQRFHRALDAGAEIIYVWGDGTPLREFLFADDLADACVFMMNQEGDVDDLYNVGSGEEVTIKELAHMVSNVVGFDGHIYFDTSKPNGTMRKMIDSSKINSLGWKSSTSLLNGLQKAYHDFLQREQYILARK